MILEVRWLDLESWSKTVGITDSQALSSGQKTVIVITTTVSHNHHISTILNNVTVLASENNGNWFY